MADVDLTNITDAVEDAVTYPILTREVGGYPRSSRNGNGHANGHSSGALTATAQSAIRDLLGWRYRADDPKGFLAALGKAVDLKDVEGHIESSWKARPFMVQADLGEVTGAQASIYERARVSVEHALPLLDTLKPLRADCDAGSAESIRMMVRSSLTELVSELGQVSGPRVQRVDDYFIRLLGSADPQTMSDVYKSPEKVRGRLGDLRARFGLERGLVLTVDEERNFTNFLILVDYTTSMLQTWSAQRQFIERNDQPNKFLGTQLVRLSETLNVIVENVHECYDAMDSVFFGPEERAVTEIAVNGQPRITVAELLAWVEHFAGVEAPQLIEDSGRDGVNTVEETLALLDELVARAIIQSES